MKGCVEAAYRRYVRLMGKPPGPMLDDYAEVVREHEAFVAEDKGRIIAVLVLIRKGPGILLDNVAVHPDFQRRGLGRRLIRFAEAESRKLGYTCLNLYTHECMTQNIEMYKAFGYRETERRTEQGYNRVYMSKPLV